MPVLSGGRVESSLTVSQLQYQHFLVISVAVFFVFGNVSSLKYSVLHTLQVVQSFL